MTRNEFYNIIKNIEINSSTAAKSADIVKRGMLNTENIRLFEELMDWYDIIYRQAKYHGYDIEAIR